MKVKYFFLYIFDKQMLLFHSNPRKINTNLTAIDIKRKKYSHFYSKQY